MSNGFAMELCGNQSSWQIVPEEIESINLDSVGSAIEAAGYHVEIRSGLCWTFTGPCDLTLYPSGKLLVKTADKELANEVARLHVTQWALS